MDDLLCNPEYDDEYGEDEFDDDFDDDFEDDAIVDTAPSKSQQVDTISEHSLQ